MKLKEACKIFNISIDQMHDKDLIKKKYKFLALKYHPDKNKSKDATKHFQEINDAYHFLTNDSDDSFKMKTYDMILKEYLKTIIENDTYFEIIYCLLTKLIIKCKKESLNYLKGLDKKTFTFLLELLKNNKYIFHLDDEYINNIQSIYENKFIEYNINLNPSVFDLLNDNIYKFAYEDQEIIIPLWHRVLRYDVDENKSININCIPELNDNLKMDEDNNLYLNIERDVKEIMNKEYLDIQISGKEIKVSKDEIKLLNYQEIVLKGQGICKANYFNVLDTSKRSSIIILLNLKA